jgi:hypothetical protein
MEPGCHWTHFNEILYLNIFLNSVEEIQVALKPTGITGTLHEDQYTFFLSFLAEFFLE